MAVPLTLALALKDALTFTDDVAAAVACAPNVASSPAQARPAEVSLAVTLAIPVAIPATAVAATFACPTETCTRTGKFVSSVDWSLAEIVAVPVMATLTEGFVQVALKEAELSHPPLQSAAASHFGGVSATAHLGAVYAIEQPPEQEPVHLAVALAVAAQEPLQFPLQVPLHATALVAVPVWAPQVPSQVPLQVPEQLAATVASTVQVP